MQRTRGRHGRPPDTVTVKCHPQSEKEKHPKTRNWNAHLGLEERQELRGSTEPRPLAGTPVRVCPGFSPVHRACCPLAFTQRCKGRMPGELLVEVESEMGSKHEIGNRSRRQEGWRVPVGLDARACILLKFSKVVKLKLAENRQC